MKQLPPLLLLIAALMFVRAPFLIDAVRYESTMGLVQKIFYFHVPAAITTFLQGLWPRRMTLGHCGQVGEALAALHLAGRDFELKRPNALSVAGWRPSADCAPVERARRLVPIIRGSRFQASADSFPRVLESTGASGCPVTMPWNASNSFAASAVVRPWTAAVISDADAREMAHPEP